jgi:hypothetical protein
VDHHLFPEGVPLLVVDDAEVVRVVHHILCRLFEVTQRRVWSGLSSSERERDPYLEPSVANLVHLFCLTQTKAIAIQRWRGGLEATIDKLLVYAN